MKPTESHKAPPSPEGRLTSKALGDYVGKLPGAADAKAAGKPALFYFYSRATLPGKRRKTPSPQAVACTTFEKSLFGGWNTRLGIAAKFFRCVKFDVTAVTWASNPAFNAQSAPVVVVVASDGTVVTTMSRSISPTTLLSVMLNTMHKSGVGTKAVFAGEAIVKKIASLENRKAALLAQRRPAQQALKRAKAKRNQAQAASAQLKLDALAGQIEEVGKALSAAREAWNKLLSS